MAMHVFRNKTNNEQSLLIGDGYVVGPYEDVVLEDDYEAKLAKERYSAVLEEINLPGVGAALKVDEDTPIWLANMSGDPDAPQKVISDMVMNKATGIKEPRFVENMLAKTVPFSIRWREKTKTQKVGSATMELKPAKRKKTIEVGERKAVPPVLARAFLRRASTLGPGSQGHIIVSRQPGLNGAYEPDMSWSLDDMRAWLVMVDYKLEETLKTEPSESQLRKEAKSEAEAKKKIDRAKLKNIRRIHLRSSNPKYVLPTRSEFEQFIGRTEVQKVLGDENAIKDAEKILAAQLGEEAPVAVKKSPGRPRKS